MMYGIHDFGFINRNDELAYVQKIKEKNFFTRSFSSTVDSLKGKKVQCISLDTLERLLKSGSPV